MSADPRRQWLMGLALALGHAHPDHLEAMLSPRQIGDWAEYYAIDPWGPQRSDQAAGLVAWSIFQSQSRKKLKVADFVPRYGPPPPPPTPRQLGDKLRAWAEQRQRQREAAGARGS